MCSYNKINDVWSCENNQTLGTDLKVRPVAWPWHQQGVEGGCLGPLDARPPRVGHVRYGLGGLLLVVSLTCPLL